MSVPILFLDIDGVLNSVDWQQRRPKREKRPDDPPLAHGQHSLDPAAVGHLNTIVARTRAKIVISSSWRDMLTHAECMACLSPLGFTGRTFGKTPVLSERTEGGRIELPAARWQEIEDWLKRHPDF